MSTVNWHHLRPWAGSQHSGFEELCCQLAAHEPAPAGAEYRRVGAPDAGVECIWRYPDGSVHGWQAKFFLRPPTAGEWGQLDHSFQQALTHYPELKAYTVCLPLDRPDARLSDQQSMMDRWNERVEKWQNTAAAAGRQVVFHYWGEHEIAERLARDKHAGRYYFWFHTQAFTPGWFRDRFAIAKANAGPRYSPELHVDLEISSVFDGLARHPRFVVALRRQWGVARREVSRAIPAIRRPVTAAITTGERGTLPTVPASTVDDTAAHAEARSTAARAVAETEVAPQAASTRQALDEMDAIVAGLDGGLPNAFPFDTLRAMTEALRQALHALDAAFDAANVSARNASEPATVDTMPAGGDESRTRRRDTFEYERYHLWRARGALYDFERMCDDEGAAVANAPALLVSGVAGTGKTHLLCDVADRAVHADEPCVLILGEQFVAGDPWPQIMRQLQIADVTPEEFLGALSSAGQAAGRRAVILIDALNEGEGRDVWPTHLAGFIAAAARYPWVGVAVSVRSSYADLVVPESARKVLTEIVHHGFAEREVDATRRFFDAHGLERPSVPLLTPEFANPLFLKLFCRGLVNRGLKRVPLGLEGITAVFEFFLASVQERLAQPSRLDFDPHDPIVEKAVSALAAEMRANNTQWVLRERARALTEQVLPRGGFERSLLKHLVSEGVLSEELVWIGPQNERAEAVRFTYERLGDHRVAHLLLDEYLAALTGSPTDATAAKPKRNGRRAKKVASLPDTPLSLAVLTRDEQAGWYNRGILEALAIQVPEHTGKELWELETGATDSTSATQPVGEAFLASLEWRRPDAIGPTALAIVDRHLRAQTSIGTRIRDLVVSAASRPGHPLNAEFLDSALAPESMPERDTWWSTHVADQSEIATPLGRLIDWAWHTGRESHHADHAVLNAGITLAWTLSTPNREVRDHATKGLVALLHSRPRLLREILGRFRSVNDPYIAERLYAVAYGCALRGLEAAELEALARQVHGAIFADEKPPPHLLLRDYARGIVEVAVAEGLLSDVEVSRARPPYRSDLPGQAPTEDELKAKYYTPFKAGENDGYFSLWWSLLAEGDFARYIVGTNSHSFEWTARPLYGPHVATKRSQYQAFVDALPSALQTRWRNIGLASFMLRLPALPGSRTAAAKELDPKAVRAGIAAEKREFRRALNADLRAEFDRVKNWGDEPAEPEPFDLQYALRWLLQRVVDLGWTPARFNRFDRRHSKYEGRTSHRSERIGKKYQWIAWHEFTARVADNFQFRGDSWRQAAQVYSGPWQLYRRDIDPSYLGRGGHGPSASAHDAWWQPVTYDPTEWRRTIDDGEWIASVEDLPRLDQVITPIDPRDNTEWWWVDGDVEWREPQPPEEETYERPRRSIRYWITTFIVQEDQSDRLVNWARAGHLGELDLHSTFSPTQVFLGEHPWAPSCISQYSDANAGSWTRLRGKLPVPVLRPTAKFYWESSGYDYSIENAINLAVPSPALISGSQGSGVHAWPTSRARAMFYNPALNTDGPDALLARAADFRQWLAQRKLDLVWIMTGEKILIGGNVGAREEWIGRLELSTVGRYNAQQWQAWPRAILNRGSGERVRIPL